MTLGQGPPTGSRGLPQPRAWEVAAPTVHQHILLVQAPSPAAHGSAETEEIRVALTQPPGQGVWQTELPDSQFFP